MNENISDESVEEECVKNVHINGNIELRLQRSNKGRPPIRYSACKVTITSNIAKTDKSKSNKHLNKIFISTDGNLNRYKAIGLWKASKIFMKMLSLRRTVVLTSIECNLGN